MKFPHKIKKYNRNNKCNCSCNLEKATYYCTYTPNIKIKRIFSIPCFNNTMNF